VCQPRSQAAAKTAGVGDHSATKVFEVALPQDSKNWVDGAGPKGPAPPTSGTCLAVKR
jgi:hypothetical protein